MTIGRLLLTVNDLDDESFILVPDGIRPAASVPAKVVPIREDPEADLGVPGFRYLIESFLAKEILEVWSEWRSGRVPTAEQAVEAVLYYDEHDEYMPVDD